MNGPLVHLMLDYPQPDADTQAYADRQLAQINASDETQILKQMLVVAKSIPADAEYDDVASQIDLLQMLWLGCKAFARLAEVDPMAAREVVSEAENSFDADDMTHEVQLRLTELGEAVK